MLSEQYVPLEFNILRGHPGVQQHYGVTWTILPVKGSYIGHGKPLTPRKDHGRGFRPFFFLIFLLAFHIAGTAHAHNRRLRKFLWFINNPGSNWHWFFYLHATLWLHFFLNQTGWQKQVVSDIFGTCKSDFIKWVHYMNKYIVACQRGGVYEEPPWLRSATRHGPLTL